MRLLKLLIKNINSFKGEVSIDFSEKALQNSIFIISGKTGSGKSTVLDSIFSALYGKNPRNSNLAEMVSQGSKTGRIELSYSYRGVEYKHTLEITKRKSGDTKKAFIYRGDEVFLDGKFNDLSNRSQSIIGLSYDSFKRTVILSQGEFIGFLKEKLEDRRKTIESISGLQNSLESIKEETNRLYQEGREEVQRLKSSLLTLSETIENIDLTQLKNQKIEVESDTKELQKQLKDIKLELKGIEAIRTIFQQRERLEKLLLDSKENLRSQKDEERVAVEAVQNDELQLIESEKELSKFEENYRNISLLKERELEVRELQSFKIQQKRTEQDKIELQGEVNELESRIEAERQRYREVKKFIGGETEKSLEAKKRKLFHIDSIKQLQDELIENQPCPVCGSREHNSVETLLKEEESLELNRIEKLERTFKEKDEIFKGGKDLKEKLNKEKSRLSRKVEELKEIQEKIEAGERALSSFDSKWSEKLSAFKNRQPHQIEREGKELTQNRNQITKRLRNSENRLQSLKTSVIYIEKEITNLSEQLLELPETDDTQFSESQYSELQREEQNLENSLQERQRKAGELNQSIKHYRETSEKLERLKEELLDREESFGGIEELQRLQESNRFRDYVLNFYMENIIGVANSYLSDMSEGRYKIDITVDGRGKNVLSIVDHLNSSLNRTLDTLSGGESFIVSLSLSLALSRISAGSSKIDFMFIDEGFGTLDQETLQVMFKMIENLNLQSRTIGVVSHITELKELITNRVEVKRVGGGLSVIE